MLKTQILSSANDQLITEWEKLWNKSTYANIVNSPGWFQAALSAFNYNGIKIITIRDGKNGELLAVAPFVKVKYFSVPFYTMPALEFADNTHILADFQNKELISFLFSEIRKLNNVYLPYINDDLLEKTKKHLDFSKIFSGDVMPYIDFAQGPYGNLPNRKKNIVLNRLNQSGKKFKILTVAPDPSDALEKTFEIDITSAKHTKGQGVFHRRDAREFYKQLAANNPSNIVITLVFFDDNPASYLIGFVCGNIYSGSQKAYVTGYEYYSLGRLSLINLLDYFREKGSPVFSLGRGSDNFKKDFTQNYTQLYNLIISKNKFILLYIPFMYTLRNNTYDYMKTHKMLYSIYKSINYKFF